MNPRFNFWLSLGFTALNLYFFFATGSLLSLGFGLFCGWQTYRIKEYA